MTGLQTNDKNEKGQNNKENEAEKDAGESEWDNLYDDSGKSLVKAIENVSVYCKNLTHHSLNINLIKLLVEYKK